MCFHLIFNIRFSNACVCNMLFLSSSLPNTFISFLHSSFCFCCFFLHFFHCKIFCLFFVLFLFTRYLLTSLYSIAFIFRCSCLCMDSLYSVICSTCLCAMFAYLILLVFLFVLLNMQTAPKAFLNNQFVSFLVFSPLFSSILFWISPFLRGTATNARTHNKVKKDYFGHCWAMFIICLF